MTTNGSVLESAIRSLRKNEAVRRAVLGLRTMRARRIERRMNIDTITLRSKREGERGLFPDGHWYEAMDYPLLDMYLQPLGLGPEDTVFDIGCGMGRILCVCAQRGVKRCVGIEIGKELADRAVENAANMRGRKAPIDVRNEDATKSDYSQGTVFILFNPFGADTMSTVLGMIRDTLKTNPRRVRLAYWNPTQEHVFEQSGWLTCTGRLSSRWYRNTASYWTNKDA